MANYVGITIGPIYDTLQLAETPSTLWYASFCFSELARLLLQEIKTQIPDADIISPYYDGSKRANGVGCYHDRIFFEAASVEKLEDVITAAKSALADIVLTDIGLTDTKAAEARKYLNNYLQVHYVILPEAQRTQANILMDITPYLDAIECMPSCNASRQTNPFKLLFSSKGEDSYTRNNRIKTSVLLQNVTDPQLFANGNRLKSIQDICYPDTQFKKSSYFALVSADGDNMGAFFNKANNDDVRDFSQKCIAYDEAAAAEIKNFGGMTIYAGGDDLLFLAPVQSVTGETIFEFCNRLSDLFREKVAKGQAYPTLSFGIAIRYMRFPLYETLKASNITLYNAKNSRPEKNAFGVDFQKHSGQSIELRITKEGFPLFESIFQQVLHQNNDSVNSIIYVLDKFASSIQLETKDTRTKNINVFINNYHNESQKKHLDYIQSLAELFCDFTECDACITTTHGDQSVLKRFEKILRLGRFFVEGGSEHE